MKRLNPETRRALYNYLYCEGSAPVLVYEEFMEDMPYGTQKARDGDPDNWLADRWESVKEHLEEVYSNDLLEESFERKTDLDESEAGGN